MREDIIKKRIVSFGFDRTPRISLGYKLVAAQEHHIED